jgi:hypothetical protein
MPTNSSLVWKWLTVTNDAAFYGIKLIAVVKVLLLVLYNFWNVVSNLNFEAKHTSLLLKSPNYTKENL